MMNIGDVVKGKITAIKPYGAFVQLEDDYIGLIHISEFSDGFVRSIEDYVSVGDVIDLTIIKVKDKKLSLSFKSLHKRKKRYTIQLDAGFNPLRESLETWINDYYAKDSE